MLLLTFQCAKHSDQVLNQVQAGEVLDEEQGFNATGYIPGLDRLVKPWV